MSGHQKLNILFLSSWYPSRVEPNLGNFVQKHAEAVALKSNVYALFVCSDPTMKGNTFEVTEQIINGVHTLNVYYKKITGGFPVISEIKKMRRYLNAHKHGFEILKKKAGRFDLVHHNILWPAGLFARWLKREFGLPYIITENNTAYLPYRNYKTGLIENFFSKKIAAEASVITPVSVDLKNAMISKGLIPIAIGTKFEIIYNVVDTHLFYPDKTALKQKIRLLHISTLKDEHKNISGILRVAAELQKQRKDFELLIAGDGDLAPHIAYAKKLQLPGSLISFKGNQSSAEVAGLMRNSDAFVLFSNYENLPCVMVEAFASGLPVVSSRVGGIPEHINDSKGLLVDARDEKGLLKVLNTLIDNLKAGKYNKEELAKYAADNFSYEKVCDRFHGIYSRITGGNVQ